MLILGVSIKYNTPLVNLCFFFQSECYHYLFDAALKLHQMGLDWSTPNHGPIQSARRGLSIAGESNVSVKARKSNGDSDPLPVSSHNPPFLFKALGH